MEIILGSVALEKGLIGPELFVALVTMALITSAAVGPALHMLGLTPVLYDRRGDSRHIHSEPAHPCHDVRSEAEAFEG